MITCQQCDGKGEIDRGHIGVDDCIRCKGKGVINITMIKLIAICGRRTSGKSTAADHIVENHGYYRLRFANRLKKMLRDGLGIDDEYIDGSKKNEPCEELCGQTVRHGMVTLGTEWGRNMIHSDMWVNALKRDMKNKINLGCDKFVIDDLRFLTEEAWLRSLKINSDIPIDVMIIKIHRNGVEMSDHQSEREIDKINSDWTVYNNSTVEELYKSLYSIIVNGGK